MSSIGFAGDWHGNVEWAGRALSALGRHGITEIYHVGDFGVWPDDRALRDEVDRFATEFGMRVHVTPGNHEYWSLLDELFAASGGEPVEYTEHITLLPPGFRWQRHGLRFLSVGGAGSIDLELRTEGEDWWPSEDISEADVERAVAGGPVDVLITHQVGDECAPEVAKRRMQMTEYSQRAIDYSRHAEVKVQRIVDAIRPRLHVHGHWHTQASAGFTDARRVYSMGKEFQPGNLALLDTETLSWRWLSLD